MRFAIIDDQEKELKELETILSHYAEKKQLSIQLACFSSGEEFLKDFSAFSYDIVFMDIYMDGISGIETAKSMRQLDNRVLLIFLTSSSEHMPEAFATHAFDYIGKPTTSARVFQVLTDALSVLPQAEKYLNFICNGIQMRIPLEELLCFSTSGHYSEIINYKGTQYRSYISFKELYHQLEGDVRFLLINKCIVVNMDLIVAFEDKRCLLTTGISFPVVLRNARGLEQTWRNYIFTGLHADMKQRRPKE